MHCRRFAPTAPTETCGLRPRVSWFAGVGTRAEPSDHCPTLVARRREARRDRGQFQRANKWSRSASDGDPAKSLIVIDRRKHAIKGASEVEFANETIRECDAQATIAQVADFRDAYESAHESHSVPYAGLVPAFEHF